MEEQVSIIVSIITALLTGGFIILFFETQHVGANVIERYHFIMQPFMHRLSNYFKFLSSAKGYFSIKNGTKKEDAEYVYRFRDLMDDLGHYAYPCIISGQDYPSSKFSATQLYKLSEDINNVWYYWDNKRNYMIDYCEYDSRKAESFGRFTREYLNEVFPHRYEESELSMDLISDISGTFYTEVYEPIQNVPFEYENWCKQEKIFQITTFCTIGLCLVTLVVILLLRCFSPLWIINLLTTLSILSLVYSLYKFARLENLSRKLIR